MTEEEQEKIREQNEGIRAERKTIIEPVAELIARFKTYFISAPIRKAMNNVMQGKAFPSIEVPYRIDE